MPRKNPERSAAIAKGELFYFTGLPCVRGHIAPRYVTAFKCVECAKDEMAEKRRKTAERKSLRVLTPRGQAIKNGDTRYKTGKPCPRGHYADRMTSSGSCVDCVREDQRQRASENEEVRDAQKIYRKKNAERYRSHVRNRRAKAKGLNSSHSQKDIDAIWDKQLGRCAYCRIRLSEGYHVDHIMPLSKGGSNSRRNLQLTCQGCNGRKSAKDPIDFARQLGRLI